MRNWIFKSSINHSKGERGTREQGKEGKKGGGEKERRLPLTSRCPRAAARCFLALSPSINQSVTGSIIRRENHLLKVSWDSVAQTRLHWKNPGLTVLPLKGRTAAVHPLWPSGGSTSCSCFTENPVCLCRKRCAHFTLNFRRTCQNVKIF